MKFLSYLFFKLTGWSFRVAEGVDPSRCVMIAAPHTSNWDLVYTIAAFKLMGVPMRYAIKKEWLFFPMNILLSPLGAIGIDRSPKKGGTERKSMVEAMADMFEGRDRIAIVVAPEGTRMLKTEWRTGFYYVAKTAEVSICCGYIDYAKKEAGVGMMLDHTENMEEDLSKIMAFYKQVTPKFPELFSTDLRYQISDKAS